jgi:anthranilate synthase component I
MLFEEFTKYQSENYDRIPVSRRLLADLDTPLSVYAKLANQAGTYLLESVENVENWGRYSIIGLACDETIQVIGNRVIKSRLGAVVEELEHAQPLQYVREYIAAFNIPEIDSLPKYAGGVVGYFGYDVARYVEPRLMQSQPKDELGIPDIYLMRSDELAIFDNFSGTIDLVVHVDPNLPDAYKQAQDRLSELEHKLSATQITLSPLHMHSETLDESVLVSGMGKSAYMDAVDRIREYVLDGDTMQVVLGHRMSMPYEADPLSLYRALRTVNPSPYMYFFNFGNFQVAGASPELLARLDDGTVTVRPIAGTRRRGRDAEEDVALEQEMRDDPKEVAEHLMLIDLGRNDCGRVAETGSVHVTEQMIVERFSHVMHMTSNVEGQIKEGCDAIDVLSAIHPAGTLSGAPKIRAMEIIDELEPTKRGLYGGAVGYIGWNGDMDTAIAIRTALIKDKKVYIQAGAGIVADSQPELEWKETMNKARALLRAVSLVLAEQGDGGEQS